MRKWKFLAASLLLAAGAVSVTSCIDDDEPSGIHEMRTAKAEYYSALAAVQQAEAQYKAALAEHELQNAELQKLKNRALELKNELRAAENEVKKDSLTARLAELQAQHEVNMQQIAVSKNKADSLYEASLKDLAIAVSKINEEYKNEFDRILGLITTNRSDYNDLAAQLTEANLELMELVTGKLDTASQRGRLNLDIAEAESKLNYLQKQKTALENVTGVPATGRDQEIANLDEQIRSEVNAFNALVDEYNQLNSQYQKEKRAYDQQNAAYEKANQEAYNTVETFALAISPEIQHDFIQGVGLTSDVQVSKKNVDGTTIYYLTNGTYTYTERPDVANLASTYSNATFVSMSNRLKAVERNVENGLYSAFANAVSLAGDAGTPLAAFDQAQYDKAMTSLIDYQNAMAKYKAVYDVDKQAWETAKSAYVQARQNYMYNSSMSYYKYAKELVDALSANAAPTAADTAAVVAALKDYGAKREALDGWVAVTPSGTTFTKDYVTLTAATYNNAKATAILGTESLKTTGTDPITKVDYAVQPYAAYIKASEKAFGTASVTDAIFTAPVEADEVLIGTTTWGGSFADYLKEYKNVNTFLKAQAWKAVYDALMTGIQGYEVRKDAAAVNEKVQKDALDALNEVSIASKIEKDMKGKDIRNATTYVEVAYSSSNPREIVLTSGVSGNLGGYINALVTLHNGLISGVTDYATQLHNLSEDIFNAEEELADAKQILYMFENGGYQENGNFLKVQIEKKEAEIAKLESKLENKNAELEQLLKQKDAFLKVLEARYPNE